MKGIISIENTVKDIREKGGISTLSLERRGLAHSIVYNIESHGNYAMRNLFKYLDLMGYNVKANGRIAADMAGLGSVLKGIRENEKYTLRLMEQKTGLYNTQIIDIEKGRGYTKNTLLKYLAAFDDLKLEITKNGSI